MAKTKFILIISRSILFLSLLGCNPVKKEASIKGIRLSTKLPVIIKDSIIADFTNQYEVFHTNNFTLYHMYFDVHDGGNGKNPKDTIASYYFVFHKDSTHGLAYDFNELRLFKDIKRMPVDSFVKATSLENNSYDDYIRRNPDSIYTMGNVFVKIYNNQPTEQKPEAHKVTFTYSTYLAGFKERLSVMDNITGMKLIKIETEAHGSYWPQISQQLPARKYLLELGTAPPPAQCPSCSGTG